MNTLLGQFPHRNILTLTRDNASINLHIPLIRTLTSPGPYPGAALWTSAWPSLHFMVCTIVTMVTLLGIVAMIGHNMICTDCAESTLVELIQCKPMLFFSVAVRIGILVEILFRIRISSHYIHHLNIQDFFSESSNKICWAVQSFCGWIEAEGQSLDQLNWGWQ